MKIPKIKVKKSAMTAENNVIRNLYYTMADRFEGDYPLEIIETYKQYNMLRIQMERYFVGAPSLKIVDLKNTISNLWLAIHNDEKTYEELLNNPANSNDPNDYDERR